MYGDLTVVQRIKLARLRWADHTVRMERDNPTRKIFLGGTRTEEAWNAQIKVARKP